jgi:hypothetical protein
MVKNGEIAIGEQTEILYEFRFSEKDGQISFVPLKDKIKCLRSLTKQSLAENDDCSLEIIKPFKDTLLKTGINYIWKGTYVVTAWDTGFVVIPPTTISTQDTVYEFNPILLKITAPLVQEGKEIYDIKEQFIEIPKPKFYWFKKNSWWIISIGLALVGFFIFKKLKRNFSSKEIVKELSLKEKTLLAINSLNEAKMWEKGKIKEHYVELSFILRSYLGSRYGLNLLEKTSYQSTILLLKKGLEKETVDTIRIVLNQSDLVKFAESTPTELEILKISSFAKQIVSETSPIEFENV